MRTFTLPHAYTNTNYSICAMVNTAKSTWATGCIATYSKTVSKVAIHYMNASNNGTSYSFNFTSIAIGY